MCVSKESATVRRLVFGGMRLYKGKRYMEWLPPDGNEAESLPYAYRQGKNTRYHVGCEYDVTIDEDGTIYGNPVFVGPSDDEDLRARLQTMDTGARQRWDLEARERKAGEDNELHNRIDDLAKLIKHLPAPQRAGMINYITHRLSRVW